MSSQTSQRIMHESQEANSNSLEAAIRRAIDNQWLIVASIDDFTSYRRLDINSGASLGIKMCTLVISIFKNVPAINWESLHNLHNPVLIEDAHISSLSSFADITEAYASIMPAWLTESFFDSFQTRWRLNAHEYYQSDDIQQLRSFENLYLFEFKELSLKSKSGFDTAINWILDSILAQYLEKYCTLQPGDHPAQFYSCQNVYEQSFKYSAPPSGSSSDTNSWYTITSISRNINQGIIQLMRPLYIALNAQEDLMEVYYPIFKYIYENLFSGSKLANAPKPWCNSFIQEVTCNGWLISCESVLEVLRL